MNILITGSSGFLSKEFKRYFFEERIFNIPREQLTNIKCLEKVIIENNIEFILHTSWAGVINKSVTDLQFNIEVQNNLQKCSHLVKNIFLFGSGAELFKDTSSDYCKGKLYVLNNAKKYSNMINLRLYGCFGEFEDDKRFVKNCVNKILNNCKISIDQDKFMDFIFVEDLCLIIKNYMKNSGDLPRNLDCVYDKKHKLSDIAKHINTLFKLNESCYNVINSPDLADPYIGCGKNLSLLNFNLTGLYEGINKIYGQKAKDFTVSV